MKYLLDHGYIAIQQLKTNTPAPEPPINADHINPSNDDQTITEEVVERWILTKDPRATLGMQYLTYRDKFSKPKQKSEKTIEEQLDELLKRPTPSAL